MSAKRAKYNPGAHPTDAEGNSLVDADTGALKVNVVAGGTTGGTGGTAGTEYTEDAAAPANPVGGAVMARRRDALAVETNADGDVTALNSTPKGELYVKQTDAIPVTDNGGSLTVDGTVAVSALPAGLATSAKQDTGNTSLASVDAKLPALSGGRVPVTVDAPVAVTGPLTDAQLRAAAVPVSAAALPLPTGAATSAKQDTGNASLASIDAKVTACDTTGKSTAALQTTGNTSLASIDGKLVTAKTADLDTGAGVDTVPLQGIALPGAGGAVVGGTSSAPLRTDPTGTTAQPVTDNGGSLTVDGTVAISGSVAVTGPLTDAQLRATAVPVSDGGGNLSVDDGAGSLTTDTAQLPGTLGQKTMANSLGVCLASDQASIPVAATCSGTVTANVGTTNGLALDATLTGGTQKAICRTAAKGTTVAGDCTSSAVDANTQALHVSIKETISLPVTGTFWQATQPISAASLPLPTGAATSAKQDTIIAALPATLGQKAMAAALAVSIASDQSAVPVTAPTITKGTQGANGFTTQDLKDAGRARVSIVFQGTGAVADALLSLVKSTNGTAAAGATSIAVAANKRLRITSMTFSVKANAAAAAFATFTLRINPTGAALIGSQSEFRVDLGNTEAVVGAARSICIPIPDGLELSGTEQLAVSALAQATTNILSVTLTGFEY
jgi:hypothetical protein